MPVRIESPVFQDRDFFVHICYQPVTGNLSFYEPNTAIYLTDVSADRISSFLCYQ